MEHPRLVKDVMVPAVLLAAHTHVSDALRSIIQACTEYGIISDDSGTPSLIVSKARLEVAGSDELVQALVTRVPYPIPVHPNDSLNSVVQMLAEDATYIYDAKDIIVQSEDAIEGIILSQEIEVYIWSVPEHACPRPPLTSTIRTTGNSRTKPPEKVIYRCSICYREQEYEYKKVSRSRPPVCHGQPMVFVRYKL